VKSRTEEDGTRCGPVDPSGEEDRSRSEALGSRSGSVRWRSGALFSSSRRRDPWSEGLERRSKVDRSCSRAVGWTGLLVGARGLLVQRRARYWVSFSLRHPSRYRLRCHWSTRPAPGRHHRPCSRPRLRGDEGDPLTMDRCTMHRPVPICRPHRRGTWPVLLGKTHHPRCTNMALRHPPGGIRGVGSDQVLLLDRSCRRPQASRATCQFSRRRDPSRQYFSRAFPPPSGEFLSIIPPSRLKFLTSIPPLA
jgi:hypothetical protein